MSRLGVLPKVCRILAIAALCASSACADRHPTEPDPAATGSLLGWPSSSSPTLVECPTNETTSKTSLIGIAGGIISIGGTSVLFPAGALPGLTTVTLTIPASKYVEIDVETDGATTFPILDKQPIITIDYWRCNRLDVLLKPLTAWYIDSETKALLEKMTTVDNKLTRSVTFTTDHFSGYAIAF
jgi:hypothetical protein